ncbi:BCD family MFS transporter [Aquibium sp. A9E412]|uniref:BCD family MFS transporter n=1 Tax=Aquibium sp. A9E412 TaxID=2976767 RepID=UPI0025B00DB0|nr:BCD family MFS transporter [Aquibium sp. A9E412]MDN2566070.1 BCD family MFS transporter [Aquibium sp. A9E412]
MTAPAASGAARGLGWVAIARLGLVQAALGSIVVLTTSTLNRVMVVELALAAVVPGLLVGLHYAVQIARPLWGHGSDVGGSRTRFILGGLALLALAGTGAAATTFLFERGFWPGFLAALACFTLIGVGIGASGTSLLALLASRTAPARRPAAATIVWMMMILGIVVTALVSGSFLDPYSHGRLVAVTAAAGTLALAIAALAVTGIERRAAVADRPAEAGPAPRFSESLAETWADPRARLFTVFVFVSMLAYSMQDLILEPFAGFLFAMTPGETTRLSGTQHGGVFIGMALVGLVGSLLARRRPEVLRLFTVGGCIGSGLALALLAVSASLAPAWPLKLNIFALGLANGAFAVAAIGTMMALAGAGRPAREGIRMGLWGAAQAVAFGLGGFLGTVAVDVTRALTGDVALSFAIVFTGEAALFVAAALIALRVGVATRGEGPAPAAAAPLQPAE